MIKEKDIEFDFAVS